MANNIKNIAKLILPKSIQWYLRKISLSMRIKKQDNSFSNKSAKKIFSTIYSERLWGEVDGERFCSGHGSHLQSHISPYVKSLQSLLGKFDPPLNVVDLGCGDFNVGSKIRAMSKKYIACDVVPELIERNEVKFSDLGVDFRVLDITKDPLPQGDLVIIRQVFQHLSNKEIMMVVPKLYQYKYLILTEYIPGSLFTPNIDQPTGAYSRLSRGITSGIVLTEGPFNLRIKSERTICETPEHEGTLRVILYEF